MNKSRVKHVNYGKKRTALLTLVAILSVSICVLGSIIGYKIYTKQSFEQKIESLQNEKEIQFGQGNQKDHFRKGQAEVVAYYPLKGIMIPLIDELLIILLRESKQTRLSKES